MSVPRRTVVDVTETQGSPAATSAADALLRDLDFTVVDVETTGWSPDVAGITEPGADHRAHRDQRPDAGPRPAGRRRAARPARVRGGQRAHRPQRPVRPALPRRGVRGGGPGLARLRGAGHGPAGQVPDGCP